MPAPVSRFARVSALAAVLAAIAGAQGAAAQGVMTLHASAAPQKAQETGTSGLDAQLFYQLLIGEMELNAGQAGTAYQVMLDAARRTKNEQIFRRATEIALKARAGDQALAAVLAWHEALPDSSEALRYEVQLLVALHRPDESLEPLSDLLRLTPDVQRPALIEALPRFYARSPDHKASAELLEKALQPYLEQPATRSVASVALGRSWLEAAMPDKALELARDSHSADPSAEGPALLALEMMPTAPSAQAIVESYLKARPDDNRMRLLYVRTLAGSQRYDEAAAQLDGMTQAHPQLAQPWLTLGALKLEMHRPAEATEALKRYVELVQQGRLAGADAAASAANGQAADAAEDESQDSTSQALTQAWLLLAQAAEQQKDYAGAEAWLGHIDNPLRALQVQIRRASILARQGKLDEARAAIRRVPEQTRSDARAKLVAEAQLLRDQKDWSEAEQVLAEANQRFTDDADLLYEQAMMDEKLDRLDEMEQLLRRVIALKPDHQNAYNALGYSLADRNIRLPEARELILKALELSPGEPYITDSLGWVEYRMGNFEEAERLLKQAYRARPDPEIAAHLGEVLWADGKTDEARQIWRDGRSRDSTNDLLKATLARLRVEL